MSHPTGFSSPYLLGFDDMERLLERVSKSAADGYPPYNVERIHGDGGQARLRITLAVAGFSQADLDITVEENKLTISGRQTEGPEDLSAGPESSYLYRGIAARQFTRTFVLADGMSVTSATLQDGLLSIDMIRPEAEKTARKIEIVSDC